MARDDQAGNADPEEFKNMPGNRTPGAPNRDESRAEHEREHGREHEGSRDERGHGQDRERREGRS